jgi:ABC-type transport system involved in Fe-S cluster assembly fused permease/ATPase subunit
LLRDKPGSAAVFQTLLLQAILAESIAIMGLVLYFVLASIQWFAIFLAVSWVVFTIIGIRLGDSVAEYERRRVEELDQDE